MKIVNEIIRVHTEGNPDLIDITRDVQKVLAACELKKGSVTVFVIGSTAAIATFEYEPGLIKDMRALYNKLIPKGSHYNHDDTWNDANGFSHLRAAIQGPSLTVPFDDGRLLLGTWQQVVLAEFDNGPRTRQIVIQVTGE